MGLLMSSPKSSNHHPAIPVAILSGPHSSWLFVSTMVFRCYDPGTKVTIVRMSLQQHSQTFIRDALGVTVSQHSFNRWTSLFPETQRVVRDPEEYSRQGRTRLLTAEDREFMLELIHNEPDLFHDKPCERLYDSNGTLMGMTTLHENLVRNLNITLKKANTVNICKSPRQKFQYIARMANVPAEFLVFTGEYMPMGSKLESQPISRRPAIPFR
ncbi:hypothetical protein MJO29_007624 [Puccinia striiformis f. sp. tritici]|nr:hypothetical protein MJO29_007624 [Puccinia striiformis f. sp. tritici]